MPTVINTHQVTIFIFKSGIFNPKRVPEDLSMQKQVMENRYIDVLGLSKSPLENPKFKTQKSAQKATREPGYMWFPVFTPEEELCLTIQVLPKSKRGSHKAGFTLTDEIFLTLIGSLFQTKLHQLTAQRDVRRTRKEVVNTIEMASVITTQRSYSDFIIQAKDSLAKFFGFEGVGIMFADTKLN